MTSEDELVEKVARAIYVVDACQGPAGEVQHWDNMPARSPYLFKAKQKAKAAIAAARPVIAQQEREKLIRKIAEVSDAVAFQAGVGGMETAGQIVSVLAKEPQHIERFMREGTELFIDGTLADAGRGCLSFHSMNGEITTPQTLREERLVDGLKKSSGAK